MKTQPEALRLADELDAYHTRSCHKEAAAELRRLHAENERLKTVPMKYQRMEFNAQLQAENERLIAQRDALLEALKEADDLLRIARGALRKLGLNGLGSDTRLSHEVRMFALEFSAESRDGPGVLQVNGTGRALNALKSIRAAIKAAEEAK